MKNMTYYILMALSMMAGNAHGVTIINNSDYCKVFILKNYVTDTTFFIISMNAAEAHTLFHEKMNYDHDDSRFGFTIDAQIADSQAIVTADYYFNLDTTRWKVYKQQLSLYDDYGKKKAIPEDSFLVFHDMSTGPYVTLLEPELLAQLRSLPHMKQLFNDIDNNKSQLSPIDGLSMLHIFGRERGGLDALQLINDTTNTVTISSHLKYQDKTVLTYRTILPGETKSISTSGSGKRGSIASLRLDLDNGIRTFINYEPRIYGPEFHTCDYRTSTVYVSSLLK